MSSTPLSDYQKGKQCCDFLKCYDEIMEKIIRNDSIISNFTLFDEPYCSEEIIEDIQDHQSTLIYLMRSKLMCIQEVVLNSTSVPLTDVITSRQFNHSAFTAIAQSILCHNTTYDNILKAFKQVSSSLLPVSQIEKALLIKVKFSRLDTCPFYHYFHTLLETYFYILVIYSVCGSKLDVTRSHVEYVIANLFTVFKVGVKDYNKPDMCACIDSFWCILNRLSPESFWSGFNKVMEKEDPILSLSFLKHIAKSIKPTKSNWSFLELKFKELLSLNANTNCDNLIVSFELIEPLVCNFWSNDAKYEILLLAWDFYSKRLNVSNSNSASGSDLSPDNMIKTLNLIESTEESQTPFNDDFHCFVKVVFHYLKSHPEQWGKVKGRIYSQLGPNKLKDLTEVGICHVLTLYLALSSLYSQEVEKKILVILDCLPTTIKYTQITWGMYVAVIICYLRKGQSVEKVAVPMKKMLQEACEEEKLQHLVKYFISNLASIINNSASMQLYQWELFGTWFDKYLSFCSISDLNSIFTVLILLLDKCGNPDAWPFWELFFKSQVYRGLKEVCLSPCSSSLLGKIAGKLVLNCTSLALEAFVFFLGESVGSKVSSSFAEQVLSCYPDRLILSNDQEALIVAAWTKACFLELEPSSNLTKNVAKLDCFPQTLKNQLTIELDPFEAFINYLADCSKAGLSSNMQAIKLCETSLGNLDRIISRYLVNPDNEQVVIKIYKYASSIFLKCGNFVYNRNRPVTILTKLTQVLLLPMDFLLGKKPYLHRFIISALKIYWSKFFGALTDLNNIGIRDPYLERTMKDLVVKYISQFPINDSPILFSILQDESKCASVILDKLASSCLKPPTSETEVVKALKIISEVAKNTYSLKVFQLLVNKVLLGLFEVIISHPQRSLAIGVVKDITNSPFYCQTKSDVKQIIITITKKYMAVNTINYFQLMTCLARFIAEDLKSELETIRNQVVVVENLRGVGFDHTLRLHLERLEKTLNENR